MEWLLIFAIIAVVLLLGVIIGKLDKSNKVEDKEPQFLKEEPNIVPLKEPAETGTVLDLTALEKYGYGDLAVNCPIDPPYSYFFFIARYRSIKRTIRFGVFVSRGFEDLRLIKYCNYDEYEDITDEVINRVTNKFDMFVDDKRFNELVCNYREGSIIEVIKKL